MQQKGHCFNPADAWLKALTDNVSLDGACLYIPKVAKAREWSRRNGQPLSNTLQARACKGGALRPGLHTGGQFLGISPQQKTAT